MGVRQSRASKGGPKNAVRRVPIRPELVVLLREHIDIHGTAPDGRLFQTYRGGIYQPSTLWRVLQVARAPARSGLKRERGAGSAGSPSSRQAQPTRVVGGSRNA